VLPHCHDESSCHVVNVLRPVDPHQSFPALERETVERWLEGEIFERSVRRRRNGPRWVFYEAPPTVNAAPGFHHLLTRSLKDAFLRYRTMRGYLVERKAGWDCHGLPMEITVEQELGFTEKGDIERYGIAQFNARCRELAACHARDWERLSKRFGYWIDLDGAFLTHDAGYVDCVWGALRMIWERDLLYEDHRVLPYCPRCQTALSSHELGQPGVYQEVVDPSVYVGLAVADPAGPLHPGDELLVWTTTPWTLVANSAVAVHPDGEYVRARAGERIVVVAAAALDRLMGDLDHDVLDRFAGRDLEGARYEPPFAFLAAEAFGTRGHTVLSADFVAVQDGTGVIHVAVAFGEQDFRLGKERGLPVVNPVRADGRYDERVGPYAGRPVKEAEPDLVESLRHRGRLFRAETRRHPYPHCWRCDTPLLYYAKPGWFIRTTAVRDRLVACNDDVSWHPAHVKDGRFGKWLEGNVDWALSRERYWGTPLPIWRCAQAHTVCVASLAELERHCGTACRDPHRPHVDEFVFPCPQCGQRMTRVPEVIDVWFDSGAMPFAQHHVRPECGADFEAQFPADFVGEGLDQTRGVFYALLAVSVLLFDRAPYRNVLCLGLVVDSQGRKMSKSLGNAVDPWKIVDRYGADAVRWYFCTSKRPWDAHRFSEHAIADAVRQFLMPLWRAYGFYVMYANARRDALRSESDGEPDRLRELDRWILSRLAGTADTVTNRLEAFDAMGAGRALSGFVEELTNWYVRRSRRRFWDEEPSAFATLHRCLVTVARLLAPFCPFVADEIYSNLDGREASVHLCDFPYPEAVAQRDLELEAAMAMVRDVVRLGLLAREQSRVKVRQPLPAAVVVAADGERRAIERMRDVVCEELNVKELRFAAAAEELVALEIKPNYRSLGPRFGKHTALVAAALAHMEPANVARALSDERPLRVWIAGHDHELSPEDVEVAIAPLAGHHVAREGAHAVALDLRLDEELRQEGLVREVVRAVQAARKAGKFDVSDRIALALGGDETLLAAARAHHEYLAGETLATSVAYDGAVEGHPVEIEGRRLRVAARHSTRGGAI
jgi:isoleucyl-tRNA synthetase